MYVHVFACVCVWCMCICDMCVHMGVCLCVYMCLRVHICLCLLVCMNVEIWACHQVMLGVCSDHSPPNAIESRSPWNLSSPFEFLWLTRFLWGFPVSALNMLGFLVDSPGFNLGSGIWTLTFTSCTASASAYDSSLAPYFMILRKESINV